MQSMVKRCQFNEYHTDLTRDIRKSLEHLCFCQSIIIYHIIRSKTITKDHFMYHVANFNQACQELGTAYRNSGLHRLEYALVSD